MRKVMPKLVLLGVIGAVCVALSGCASCSRTFKSFNSDMNGGLERKVTLYSTTGEEIKSWEGKFDVSDSEDEVYFDLDGKRVIIHGGIVVNEEL